MFHSENRIVPGCIISNEQCHTFSVLTRPFIPVALAEPLQIRLHAEANVAKKYRVQRPLGSSSMAFSAHTEGVLAKSRSHETLQYTQLSTMTPGEHTKQINPLIFKTFPLKVKKLLKKALFTQHFMKILTSVVVFLTDKQIHNLLDGGHNDKSGLVMIQIFCQLSLMIERAHQAHSGTCRGGEWNPIQTLPLKMGTP